MLSTKMSFSSINDQIYIDIEISCCTAILFILGGIRCEYCGEYIYSLQTSKAPVTGKCFVSPHLRTKKNLPI